LSIEKGWSRDLLNNYDVDRLIYFETYRDVRNAIRREKQLKGWRREKKIALIEKANAGWKDLARAWYEGRGPSTRTPSLRSVALRSG
jgi:predicted GIY-YIG superfamily endonuclease